MPTQLRVIAVVGLLSACATAKPESAGDSSQKATRFATVNQGEAQIEAGEFAAAAETFAAVLARDDKNAEAHYYLGVAKSRLGDAEAAEKHYRAALERDARLAPAHNNLGLLLLERGDLPGAERELEAYVNLKPDAADARFNFALLCEAKGDAACAASSYERAAKLDPQDPSPWIGLGDLARRAKDPKTALDRYNKARGLAPSMPEISLKEAQALVDLGRQSEASSVLGALADNPAASAELLATAGILVAKLGDGEQAIALYRAAIARDESYADAHFLLGNALARAKRFAEAATEFERFLALAPNAPQVGEARKRLDACRNAPAR